MTAGVKYFLPPLIENELVASLADGQQEEDERELLDVLLRRCGRDFFDP